MIGDKVQRVVRSYVLRQGRITEGQRRVLNERWEDYGLNVEDGWINYPATFQREVPVILEIGFGNGRSLAEMAASSPDEDFIGVEVHRPGVGHLMIHLERMDLTNVRCYCADVNAVLDQAIPDNSLSRAQIFFPDPWPKKRHHKRRLVQQDFIKKLITKIKVGGTIHLATDWEAYAIQMMTVLSGEPALLNSAGEGEFHPRTDYRPVTKFEEKGMQKGHGVWDLIFQVKPRS